MALAPALPFVSEEEYLRTEYEPECEYIDGILIPKKMGSRSHGRFQLLLAQFLFQGEKTHGYRVYPEQHLRIAPRRYRVPDILLIREDHAREEVLTEAPLATIEIVSKDETWAELAGKFTDHLALGTGVVLIVNPYESTVFVHDGASVHPVPPPCIVEVAVPRNGPLSIDFTRLFADLD